MDYMEIICKIIHEITDNYAELPRDQDLRSIGIDSVQYFQILANIEDRLDIVFSDEFLLDEGIMTIDKIIQAIEIEH